MTLRGPDGPEAGRGERLVDGDLAQVAGAGIDGLGEHAEPREDVEEGPRFDPQRRLLPVNLEELVGQEEPEDGADDRQRQGEHDDERLDERFLRVVASDRRRNDEASLFPEVRDVEVSSEGGVRSDVRGEV